MLAQIIMLLVVTLAGLVCLGWALWYTALWLSGYTCWDAVGWSVFMYQFGAVICAVFAVGYWNYLSETRAKSILLSLLGVLFFVNLNISFAVPFVQRLESRLPLLLRGTETQGRVVRVYMRETEDISFLFHSKKIKQRWEPRVEYEFASADGVSYRSEAYCHSSGDMQQGQKIPVLYLPENPQTNLINLFFYMWADSILFGAGSLGALCLTWYIFSRQVLGKKRRATKRIRYRRRG